jgi:hypothetical protein
LIIFLVGGRLSYKGATHQMIRCDLIHRPPPSSWRARRCTRRRFAGVDSATREFHGIVHCFAFSTVLRLETAATSRFVLLISRFALDYGGETCSPPWMVEIVCDAALRGGPARRLVQRRISGRKSAGRSKPCR